MSQYLTLTEMQNLADTKNVLFMKNHCPFCHAAQKLVEVMKDQGVIDAYDIFTLDTDFDNDTLGELARNNGWVADGGQNFPSKPQIFFKGQYIGGNFELYKSKWNMGEGKPNLVNPMRF
jgi:glutaredoxin